MFNIQMITPCLVESYLTPTRQEWFNIGNRANTGLNYPLKKAEKSYEKISNRENSLVNQASSFWDKFASRRE